MKPEYASVEVINGVDLSLSHKSFIRETEVKRLQVRMLVNKGSMMLAINENIQAELQLPFAEKRKVQLADGQIAEYDVAGPVELRFSNRSNFSNAIMLPGDPEPKVSAVLLGGLSEFRTTKFCKELINYSFLAVFIIGRF